MGTFLKSTLSFTTHQVLLFHHPSFCSLILPLSNILALAPHFIIYVFSFLYSILSFGFCCSVIKPLIITPFMVYYFFFNVSFCHLVSKCQKTIFALSLYPHINTVNAKLFVSVLSESKI